MENEKLTLRDLLREIAELIMAGTDLDEKVILRVKGKSGTLELISLDSDGLNLFAETE